MDLSWSSQSLRMGERDCLGQTGVAVDDPGVCMSPHSDMDGVIRRANATEYGLASGVFTKDISKVSECVHLTQMT